MIYDIFFIKQIDWKLFRILFYCFSFIPPCAFNVLQLDTKRCQPFLLVTDRIRTLVKIKRLGYILNKH